jgi:SPP1 family predicted phage head-tail adaptor
MPPIAAGALSEYITLERPEVTADSAGGEVTVWREAAKVWAQVKPLSAREQAAVPQITGIAVYTYTIRALPDVDDTWRIRHDGQILEIKGVLRFLPDMIQLMAELKR